MPASDQPFELLKRLEACSRRVAGSRGRIASGQGDWVGVGFTLAGQALIAAREEVREVLTLGSVARLPGAKPWLLGLANVRSQLLPIVDLKAFGGGEPTAVRNTTRVLAVNHADIPAGLVVDEVRGLRRFEKQVSGPEELACLPNLWPYLAGSHHSERETWSVLNLTALVESSLFLQAADWPAYSIRATKN